MLISIYTCHSKSECTCGCSHRPVYHRSVTAQNDVTSRDTKYPLWCHRPSRARYATNAGVGRWSHHSTELVDMEQWRHRTPSCYLPLVSLGDANDEASDRAESMIFSSVITDFLITYIAKATSHVTYMFYAMLMDYFINCSYIFRILTHS